MWDSASPPGSLSGPARTPACGRTGLPLTRLSPPCALSLPGRWARRVTPAMHTHQHTGGHHLSATLNRLHLTGLPALTSPSPASMPQRSRLKPPLNTLQPLPLALTVKPMAHEVPHELASTAPSSTFPLVSGPGHTDPPSIP